MIKGNKKIILGTLLLFLLIGIFYTPTPISINKTSAVSVGLSKEYVPLAPLPNKFFPGDAETKYDLPNYLSGMFKILLAVAGLLSVVMIVIGGIEYMSTDAISGKSEGKERITNAVLGLLLALISWLILYTINPKLLEFNLNSVTPIETPAKSPANKIDQTK